MPQRIRKTAFGRSMLEAVKAQMSTGAKSFNSVQDFIDQVCAGRGRAAASLSRLGSSS
jgi:hypothetical protein